MQQLWIIWDKKGDQLFSPVILQPNRAAMERYVKQLKHQQLVNDNPSDFVALNLAYLSDDGKLVQDNLLEPLEFSDIFTAGE